MQTAFTTDQLADPDIAASHAEIRKWVDPDTRSKKIVAAPKGPIDVPWIQVRTTAPLKDDAPWPP